MRSLQIRRFVVVGLLVLGMALWLAVFTSRAGAGQTTVGIESSAASVGQESNVTLFAEGVNPPGLGSWTVDVTYDPSVVTLVSCEAKQGGLCNEAYGNGVFRVAGVSVTGLEGTVDLAHATFQCLSEGRSTLIPTVDVLSDATIGDPQAVEAAIQNGSVTCSADEPTETPEVPSPPPGSDPDKLLGDADCDEDVDSIDAALVLQFGAGLLEVLPCKDDADANQDGTVNAVDAALILQVAAGLLNLN